MNIAVRTIILTGATRGIGREAAREILRRAPGTHLVILGRSASAGEVMPSLREISPHVSTIDIDLASMASVTAAIAQVEDHLNSGALPPLSGLIFNAGVHLSSALESTVDGYERTFAVNVMSTHQLLRQLHPHLTSPSRVVVTVSDAHFGDLRHTAGTMPPPRWSDPEILSRPGAFDSPEKVRSGRRAYVTSKLGGVHLVHEWSRRLPEGIDIVAYNPSLVVGTGLARETGGAFPFLMRRVIPVLALTPLVDTPMPAGQKLADVALGATVATSGSYVHREKIAASSSESYDLGRELRLWSWLEQELGESSPGPPHASSAT
ncbi:SDR family NAD(P)-dependent oxidoreductase [Citricoccus sp. K5]|uniref:SDR family NAD(P)-dependent oxidoreductase n=1 Tax=Citricoccus sp. K5 TaxID=2653135 RepID=UPI0012F437F7|nr:SDR family NAD(P)-dependent oxidoreductase [Citricoccus sp. K5]VXB80173.1 Short-chain dehydrogenase [Citricoccus sp. K5]